MISISFHDTFMTTKKVIRFLSLFDLFLVVKMLLVAHFKLKLHQIKVKIIFVNGNIDETIYIMQSENFMLGDPKSMVCKHKKFIYRLKQASRQC